MRKALGLGPSAILTTALGMVAPGLFALGLVPILAIDLGIAPPALAAETSFDCTKTTSDVEKLICKDESLAALDRKLAKVYKATEKSIPAQGADLQKGIERGWIEKRDACARSKNVIGCIQGFYERRIIELQIAAGQVKAVGAATYSCQGEDPKPLSASFYNATEPPSAVLTYDNQQIIAFLARSGSGARYTADGVEFWEHQGEATVKWMGTDLTCTSKDAPAKTGT